MGCNGRLVHDNTNEMCLANPNSTQFLKLVQNPHKYVLAISKAVMPDVWGLVKVLAAIAAAILQGHSHIATGSLSSLLQIRKQTLYPDFTTPITNNLSIVCPKCACGLTHTYTHARTHGLAQHAVRIEHLDCCACWPKVGPFLNKLLVVLWTLVEECKKRGVQCTAYCPLGGPGAIKPNKLLQDPLVAKLAQETNKSPAQTLLWPSLLRSSTSHQLG
eukprot:1138230-Pelagomonas_calceolata.AAC.4